MTRKLGQVSPTQPEPENDDVEDLEGRNFSHAPHLQNLGRGEGEAVKNLMSYSQSRKIADENFDRLLEAMRAVLSGSMDNLEANVSGSMDNLEDRNFRVNGKVDGEVRE